MARMRRSPRPGRGRSRQRGGRGVERVGRVLFLLYGLRPGGSLLRSQSSATSGSEANAFSSASAAVREAAGGQVGREGAEW